MGLSPAMRVLRAIERVGATASLLGAQRTVSFMASIQPVRDRSLQPLREGPWGVDRRRRAAMLAPWCGQASSLRVEDRLRWQGQAYRVLQVETVEFGGEPLYIWAMLEQQGREGGEL